MKKLFYLFVSIILVASVFYACIPNVELPGSIVGVVTDKSTGEPIRAAGIELSPKGLKTTTGYNGYFEFSELDPGSYSLFVTKQGYIDTISNKIEVVAGQASNVDVQLEILPPALKVVDDNNVDLKELHYGDAEADIARSFNIYNDGLEELSWELVKTAIWIDSISKYSGKLTSKNKHSIVVFIDRNKLDEGENKTTLQITSTNGSRSLSVVAINNRKSIVINTLECTSVKGTSAVFNAELVCEGNPKYTERGFVYSDMQQPTLENTIQKLTSPVDEKTHFSVEATNLAPKTTYYVRAYAINPLGVFYSSNQISFVPQPSLPSVVTDPIKDLNIEKGTAIFNGRVTNVGDPAYSERGFVYGIVPNPTIDDTKKQVYGAAEGAYSVNITNLKEGNTYYVRAYALNEKGIAYGKDVVVNCEASKPEVITNEVTNISIKNGTATFVGEVKSYGDLTCHERGFVYALVNNPTIDDTKLPVSGAELGVFRKNVSDLKEGNTYYIRAYVTNANGTVYGNEVSCDLTASKPTVKTLEVSSKNFVLSTATFKGSIVSAGDLGYIERGFVYATVHNPTIGGNKVVAEGSGIGEFSATATQLEEGKIYYIRAFVTTSKETVYGEDVEMDYTAKMPEVKTVSIVNKNIVAGTATFKGNIVSLGDLPYTERGFVYGVVHNPTIDDNKVIASGSGAGDFTASASGLTEGKTYYVRAYVTNKKGTVYGEELIVDYTASKNVVKTLEVTNKNIAAGTATFLGSITSMSDLGYTERGFAYATVHNPTIGDSKVIAEGSGAGEFSATSTQLAEGKIYYIRAYVTNSKETVYGEEIEMDYTAVMPVVKTVSIVSKNIATGTATFKGNIVSLGDLPYTERGFVYGVVHNPTIDDSKVTALGSGAGDFTASASGLTEGKTYYVRAYVTNKKGIVYGEELTMDYTAGKTVVQTLEVISKNFVAGTATFKGSIVSVSELGYSERGFVYSTVHNPTIGDSKVIAEGSGAGEFSATSTQLAEGKIYYIRAYVTNSKETVYGEEIEMDYTAVMPVVKTVSIVSKNIATGTATFKGNIVSLGDLPYTERGFVYGVVHNPTIDDSKVTALGSGAGDFTASASGLTEGKTYYVRAYVTNKKGTVYGEELTMDYTASMPEVKTLSVTNKNIGLGTATFKGSIISIGDLGYTERGFAYATFHNPTIGDNKLVVEGSGAGEYSTTAKNLEEGKIYYIRAYVTNSKGTVYGEEVNVDFNGVMPVVSTQPVTNKVIAQGVATLNGTIESKGDPAYTQRGFVYGMVHNPTLDDATIVNVSGTSTGTYTYNLNNLIMGNVYYVRAFATNLKGTAYGSEVILDNNAIAPQVTTVSVEAKSNSSAYFVGNITEKGDPEYTERGFVYGTMQNPIIDDIETTKLSVAKTSSNQFEMLVTVPNLDKRVYYVRAYAKNATGTVYGDVLKLVHPDYEAYNALSTFTFDGATYRVHSSADIQGTWQQAMSTCEGLDFGGYSDWILPTKDMLNIMYINKENIGGFLDLEQVSSQAYKTYAYWSSTVYSDDNTRSWLQSFATGEQAPIPQTEISVLLSSYPVHRCYFMIRCIRKE